MYRDASMNAHARSGECQNQEILFFHQFLSCTTIEQNNSEYRVVAFFRNYFVFLWPRFWWKFSLLLLFPSFIWNSLFRSVRFLPHSDVVFSYLIFNPYTAFCHFACENVETHWDNTVVERSFFLSSLLLMFLRADWWCVSAVVQAWICKM